jgi:HlyD family secretion protein
MKKIFSLSFVLAVPVITGVLWTEIWSETVTTKKMAASIDLSNGSSAESSIHGIGFVEPVTEVRKLVFKVNGVISRCSAEIGQSCKKGSALMELDNHEQFAAMAVAEAEWKLEEFQLDKVLSGINPHQIEAAALKVDVLKEQVRYLAREHEKYRALVSRDSVSHSEYDRVLTELIQKRTELKQMDADLQHLKHHVRDEDRQLAIARVRVAKAKLDLARQHYEDTILRAPFDGTILELLKREGEGSSLFGTEPVAIFGDTSRLRVRAEVDERFVARLKVGQGVTVSGRGLAEQKYSGRVAIIKSIMGKKTVFSRSATERKDLDVIQLIIEMDKEFVAPIGLELDVEVFDSIP